jgi:hypothetical protein
MQVVLSVCGKIKTFCNRERFISQNLFLLFTVYNNDDDKFFNNNRNYNNNNNIRVNSAAILHLQPFRRLQTTRNIETRNSE